MHATHKDISATFLRCKDPFCWDLHKTGSYHQAEERMFQPES